MRLVYLVLLAFSITVVHAQKISSARWSDLFSYNNVLQIREDDGQLIAATENGIFYYNISSGEIKKLSKANGLHEVKISAFDYNPTTKVGLVGYQNGTLDVITEDNVTYVVDIPIATGYSGDRKINHISINGNRAVISVGYGVSVFNLERKEFEDTAFFMENGRFIGAVESIIKGDQVYAITNSGIKSHIIDVTFPVFSSWNTVINGSFKHISTDGTLIAYSDNTKVSYGNGQNFLTLSASFGTIKDIVVAKNTMIISENNKASIYNNSGVLVKTHSFPESLNSAWSTNNLIYGASTTNGILNENSVSIKPDGPYNNKSYKISIVKDKLLVSTGSRDGRYNAPIYDSNNLGFYFYNGSEWIYPNYFKQNPDRFSFNVLDAVMHPSNGTEIFIANYGGWNQTNNGFLKLSFDKTTNVIEFEKFYPSFDKSRAVGLVYDDQNNLFASSSFDNSTERTIYYTFNKSSDEFVGKIVTGAAAQKPIFNEGLLYIPTPRANEFVSIDLNNTSQNLNDDIINIYRTANGLPANGKGTLSATVDKSNDLWVGSDNGLRILRNASQAIKEGNVRLEPIIIEQKGIGEELFRDSAVLQIEADSGNQKWVSVEQGGVFYLNASGENQIHHFTKENSPLPTNSVTDIKVDEKTGKVYFVTFDGIVVYQGDVANVNKNFGDVLVYPNPVVYANFKGNVRIKGLAEKTNIRITDAAGNLVHQAVTRGGYYEWDLTNRGKRVASGIYFVLMTNDDATDKATAKIAVVN